MNLIYHLGIWWRSSSSKQLNVIGNIIVRYTASEMKKSIVIPKRIHRGPTDILRALSATVERDYTAPHYKYHDDPYLIPVSNPGKRSFAMAKESGRKAAQWIRDQNPSLFQHQVADPPIKSFVPRTIFDDKSEVDEETLIKVIEDISVSDAITVYQLLEKQGKVISQATKQSLLELLCFYNCEDSLPEELIEERWFRQGLKGREKQRKTWKDNGLAEAVFKSMKSPSSAAHCTLIQGMARYCQAERAWQLYQQSREQGIPLCTATVNSLISVTNFLRESSDLRWLLVQELLTDMSKQGLRPNVGTINSVLEVISTMGTYRHRKYALRVLAEFRQLNIQLSLASYYYLLIIFCKERGPVCNILSDIMNDIEKTHFTIQDPKDTFFFVTAMDVCRNHLQDKELAFRVDRLLHLGNNYDLIGDSYKESIYYRHFFLLLCTTEPLDVFMTTYNKLVPHIYIPEPSVMEEVIKAIDLNGAAEILPRIWSDMVVFDHTERENLVAGVLASMVSSATPQESELAIQFGRVAWDIWTRLEEKQKEKIQYDRYSQLSWTGGLLGDILILSVRAGNLDNAYQILSKLMKEPHSVSGVPGVEALQEFLDTCIAEKNIFKAIQCIEYCVDIGFSEAGRMAQQLRNSIPLDDRSYTKLTSIVGNETMQTKEESASPTSQ